jgi:RNase P/RNase MRP subunit p29
MSKTPEKPGSGPYEVGYGKPPLHTRFRKGQSGNPRGRPRGANTGGLKAIVVKEAYRTLRVREGDRIKQIPAIRAILRAMITHGAKGNGPAQRALIEFLRLSEQELAAEAAAKAKDQAARPLSDLEVARRIAFVLSEAARGIP